MIEISQNSLMKTTRYLTLFIGLAITPICVAQNQVTGSDSTYYDHWVGEWYQEVDGELHSEPTFVVKRALYHSSFEEYWMGAGGNFSIAWRAWDSRTRKWDFAWMSTDGLFQIWEGKKVDGIWYIYKTFMINDQEVLSRQAFIPENDRTVIRTSEHSSDNGKTWRLRFREIYKQQ